MVAELGSGTLCGLGIGVVLITGWEAIKLFREHRRAEAAAVAETARRRALSRGQASSVLPDEARELGRELQRSYPLTALIREEVYDLMLYGGTFPVGVDRDIFLDEVMIGVRAEADELRRGHMQLSPARTVSAGFTEPTGPAEPGESRTEALATARRMLEALGGVSWESDVIRGTRAGDEAMAALIQVAERLDILEHEELCEALEYVLRRVSWEQVVVAGPWDAVCALDTSLKARRAGLRRESVWEHLDDT